LGCWKTCFPVQQDDFKNQKSVLGSP